MAVVFKENAVGAYQLRASLAEELQQLILVNYTMRMTYFRQLVIVR